VLVESETISTGKMLKSPILRKRGTTHQAMSVQLGMTFLSIGRRYRTADSRVPQRRTLGARVDTGSKVEGALLP
jgi:hypothetical protein